MPETAVITDTSCLIALSKTGMLGVLRQMYSAVFVTHEILEEFGEPLPEWIHVRSAFDSNYSKLLETTLDAGEASAIALAFELENAILILDDLKARKEAKRLGFRVTGTLGVLFAAKQRGVIPALKPHLETLQASGFRIAPSIIAELIALSGESSNRAM